MEVDKFTKTNSERMADEVAADDFIVDYSCASSVFAKNPINEDKNPEPAEIKKGLMDYIFEAIEEYLDKNKKNSPMARKFKVMLNFFKVKDTLGRLNKINSSVDELVNLKVPFGEQEKRYEILADRLIRANHLHTQIQKELS